MLHEVSHNRLRVYVVLEERGVVLRVGSLGDGAERCALPRVQTLVLVPHEKPTTRSASGAARAHRSLALLTYRGGPGYPAGT